MMVRAGRGNWRRGLRGPSMAAGAIFLALVMVFPNLPLFFRASDQILYSSSRPEPEMPGADTDHDGLYNNIENDVGSDPLVPDTDADRMEDGPEYGYWSTRERSEANTNNTTKWLIEFDWLHKKHPKDSTRELARRFLPTGDLDGDRLGNIIDSDSDGDGLEDGAELDKGTDPANPDTDLDGIIDSKDPDIDPIGPDPPPPPPRNESERNLEPSSSNFSADRLERSSFQNVSDLDKKVLFWVEPADRPRYWRTAAFDEYSGGGWTLSDGYRESRKAYTAEELPTELTRLGLFPDEYYRIVFNGDGTGFLPTTLHTTRLYSVLPASAPVGVDNMTNFFSPALVFSYNFTAFTFAASTEQLKAGRTAAAEDHPALVQLPASIPVRTGELADALAEGQNSSFGKITAILAYLKTNYVFSRSPPQPAFGRDPVDYFLFSSRRGGSLDFASAFVVLARELGMPCRLVTGFAVGELIDGKRAVRAAHYHAWAEVLFKDLGWIQLETSSTDNGESPASAGADGSDPTVGDITTSGNNSTITMGASGGQTTQNTTANVTLTPWTALFNIQYSIISPNYPLIWKGEVFEVAGRILAPAELRSGAALAVFANATDQLVGRGRSGPDGSFSVLCNADGLPVGEKAIGISVSAIRGDRIYNGSTPQNVTRAEGHRAILCSNTTLDINSKDYGVSGNAFSYTLDLRDVGGLSPPWPEFVNVRWNGGENMTVEYKKGSIEQFILTGSPGRGVLSASFEGSACLGASSALRNISVKSGGLTMKVSFQPAPPERSVVGNNISVTVDLVEAGGRRLSENVSASLDDELTARGRANSSMSIWLDPAKMGSGHHSLKGMFSGNDMYPELSETVDVLITGSSRMVLAPQNLSLGNTSGRFRGALLDNLGFPIYNGKVRVAWTDTLGEARTVETQTNGSGGFQVVMATSKTQPTGPVLVSAFFNNTADYTGCSASTMVYLTSPSNITATMPRNITRGEQFEFSGYLSDHLQRPIPRALVSLRRGAETWGQWRADDTGNFSVVCDVPALEPAGKTRLLLVYAGEGFREAGQRGFDVGIFARCRLNLTVPSGLEQGGSFDAVAVLTDDLGNPVAKENLTFQFAQKSYTRRTDGFGRVVLNLGFPFFSTSERLTVRYGGEGYNLPVSATRVLRAEPTVIYRLLVAVAIVAAIMAGIYIFRKYGWHRALDWPMGRSADRSWMTDRYRRTICKVYARLLARMGRMGNPRHESLTVREYERQLGEALPLDQHSLSILTVTFEEARYSLHRMTSLDSRRAVVNYRKLMNSLEPEQGPSASS